jgi:hypothetical protein
MKKKKSSSNKAIKKVDIHGKVIQDFKSWRIRHPKALYFDSKFEWRVCELFNKFGVDFIRNEESFLLQESFSEKTINTSGHLYNAKVREMTYKPDMIVKCPNGVEIYVETKGLFREDARMRFKLFQYRINKKYNGRKIAMVIKYGPTEPQQLKYAKAFIKILMEDFGLKSKANNKILDI